MTTKEAKQKLFDAVQLLMEVYQELSERTTLPAGFTTEGKKMGPASS